MLQCVLYQLVPIVFTCTYRIHYSSVELITVLLKFSVVY